MPRRSTPYVDLRTNDTQYAYRRNKSTTDVIYSIKSNLGKNLKNPQILLDLSKDFRQNQQTKFTGNTTWGRTTVEVYATIKKRTRWGYITQKSERVI